jgi:hypothetical protein
LKPAQTNSLWDPISKKPITKKGWRGGSRCRFWIQFPVPQKKKRVLLVESCPCPFYPLRGYRMFKSKDFQVVIVSLQFWSQKSIHLIQFNVGINYTSFFFLMSLFNYYFVYKYTYYDCCLNCVYINRNFSLLL